MAGRTCLAIVLAAGEGTRMRSSLPKVLHKVAGRTLLAHVLAALKGAGSRVAVVVGPGHDAVAAEARAAVSGAEIFVQTERRGTAHAVLAARAAIERGADDVLVIFGDTPLIRPDTLDKLRAALAEGAAVAVLGFKPADPTGYGRLVTEGGELLRIVEHNDASESERAIALCNGGLMALAGKTALPILDKIGCDNRKHEFYLTDAVAIARAMKLRAVALEVTEDEVSGINTKAQLADTEAVMQQRLRQAAMDAGVTLVAPETVHLAADTKLGRRRHGRTLCRVRAGRGGGGGRDHPLVLASGRRALSAATRSSGRSRGCGRAPSSRRNVHIGNFVEVKEATIEAGAKANHLAYIGDARDRRRRQHRRRNHHLQLRRRGQASHRYRQHAFIGSNSALVAPVKIGDGAYVGSGSVITADVPADALALGRGRQIVKEGWAQRLRDLKSRGKRKDKASD